MVTARVADRPTTLRELRRHLAEFRQRSLAQAISRAAFSFVVYVALFAAAIAAPSAVLQIVAGLFAGLFAGNLFMIGHDACHGSYTRSARVNRVLGRIVFLPSYHPYSLWELSHNRIHHVHTNLRTRDFVWKPLTKAEFDALPTWRRALHRVCRTSLGLALYYTPELWWPRLMAPAREVLDRPRRSYLYDRVLVLSFMLAQLAVAALVSPSPAAFALALACGVVLPWLVFCWLIGFVIYFNHTHPDVKWFDSSAEWTSFEGMIAGTTRLAFPRWTGWFASNIMNHVAHHVDPRIPLVRLGEAQARIEQLLPGDVCVEGWSVSRLRTILRSCKLYDYDAQCWLDYDGQPTTRSLRP